MYKMYNGNIAKRLYKVGKYGRLLELYGYRILFCNFLQITIRDKMHKVCLYAYVWRSGDILHFKRYDSEIFCGAVSADIRKILIRDIMKQVIEKEIML